MQYLTMGQQANHELYDTFPLATESGILCDASSFGNQGQDLTSALCPLSVCDDLFSRMSEIKKYTKKNTSVVNAFQKNKDAL